MAKPAEKHRTETPAQLEHYLRELLFIRHFEEKCNFAYRAGNAFGYMHTYIGMEALAVGFLNAIRRGDDYVITAYRDHPHALLLGVDPVKVMAEIMGRSGGTSRGKGGSMHLYSKENNFFGGWGIVGGHVPLGTGLAFSSWYRDDDKVTLCFLGDGAANAGVVYESLNMAGLWDLPCIYVIENNRFAMGTRLEYHAADTELWKRGHAFDIKSERIDAMDVLETARDAQRIVDWVRKNKKPYFVEAMCYRYVGHGAADNDRQLYRTKEEEADYAKQDPVKRLEAALIERNVMTHEKIEAIEADILKDIDRIYEQALASPDPDPAEVYDHVYTDLETERGH